MSIVIPRPLERAGRMQALFATQTPPQWLEFARRKPWARTSVVGPVELRQAHADRLLELVITGRRAYSPDRPGADHWDDEPPFVDGVQTPGFDCENLALWARREMAEEFDDWPLCAGRPTTCTVEGLEGGHCVLVIATANYGDLVVGARPGEDLVPWESLQGYSWRRQLQEGDSWAGVLVTH